MKFESNEKSYDLKYTVNAVADMEEMTGAGLSSITQSGEIYAMRALFWAGLIDSNPELTVKQAGDIMGGYIQAHGPQECMVLITKSLEESGFIRAQAARKPKR